MSRDNYYENIIKQMIKLVAQALKVIVKGLREDVRKTYDGIVEKMRFSLTFKITFAYARKITRMLIFLSFIIIGAAIAYLLWNAEGNMKRDFALVSESLKNSSVISSEEISGFSKIDNLSITIFDDGENVLYASDDNSKIFYDTEKEKGIWHIGNKYALVPDKLPVYYELNWAFDNTKDNLGYAMIFNEKIQWNSKYVYIQIKNRLIKESTFVIVLFLGLFVVNLMLIISALITGSRASRRILKPIETMTRTVENITINELGTRLDIKGSQDELKDLARTFNGMLDRLQQSYEQQNQFVSDASHELRTPISVIQGYANLLDRWGKNDEQVLMESIAAIKSESENMKDLVEKLLFLARSDKNTQKVEKESFSLNELIDEIIRETKLIDNAHEIVNEKNETIEINADRKLIKEALRIFIDNSIKYTPEGGRVRIDSCVSNGKVQISIEDNGIGISKEDLPHIFDRFYRADKSRTRETGGTGLGLAIAKWIILKHDGKINVESEINKGTRIIISLPYINS